MKFTDKININTTLTHLLTYFGFLSPTMLTGNVDANYLGAGRYTNNCGKMLNVGIINIPDECKNKPWTLDIKEGPKSGINRRQMIWTDDNKIYVRTQNFYGWTDWRQI